MIKEFEVRKNDKRRQEDMDILEEQREIASIREAHYKQKLKMYYNKRVRPSTFKPCTYMLQLNSASKAEFQGKRANIGMALRSKEKPTEMKPTNWKHFPVPGSSNMEWFEHS
ncbi:hypothetical protein Tco_1495735 [Tanacetum coccineum]